ncbi:MAG: hypothetical protein RMJ53_09200 [Chitinophagales bacterium]|nr:hypothetical protein [Chitinophagales bacterium]MDW8274390.1 hypothetical protein [Chitinophagales bacterium]
MKPIFCFLILVAVNFLIGRFFQGLEWWYIAFTAFAVGYYGRLSGLVSWIVGFSAVFLLWYIYAYYLDHEGGRILSPKMAELFSAITQESTIILFIFTGLIGGLVSGFACLSGAALNLVFNKK